MDTTVQEKDGFHKDEEAFASSSEKETRDGTISKLQFVKGFRFWAILASVSVTSLLTSLEATIVSTALPTIITELHGANKYIWVSSGYLLTMTTLQPIYGQLANVFGRRYPLIFAAAIFTLGSGICGGSNSVEMLIAGRVLQGIGAAGISVLVEIIVCDIVPLRERGTYLGIVMGFGFLGSALGPLFGGLIVENISWRWVFYLNLPVGGAALVALFLFLQVKFNKEMTIAEKLRRMDFGGSLIFVGSVVSILIALAWAGSLYAWSTVQVIVPLVLGFIGLICFLIYEAFVSDPIMPLHLFQNRTSLVAFVLTFLHGIATVWLLYFLPVYFQAVLQASTERSGIDLLPTIFAIVPFAIAAGVVMGKIGRYKPIHVVGFAVMMMGFGLLTLLNENSSTAAWVLFQVVESLGAGLVIPTLLPAVMAELTDADTGSATGTWSFMRGFGMTWGVTIPSAIFNDQTTRLASRIQDPSVVAMLTGGQAYEHATRSFVESLTDPTVKSQVISIFTESLKRSWQIGIAFPALGFLIVFLEKEIPLRQELNTEYGIEDGKEKDKEKA
ncbi:hypothetical protein UA08_04632 [Talaromyces atroroseus]|uniref:Major facilitator superfamily (MFS) profile domain-containing protein n=1 Tax=Talaromyces atroroseus TaxID=1441469 RepID=A0A225B061_TALAT|nr:hypothetical protein UA08_04632 [Talaromyces atroroseus]OKL60115.1 hypothetical protein UA08_04632 [Talaromyces atroroseus]